MALCKADEVRKTDTLAQTTDGRWVPARSLNYQFDGWRKRLQYAWGVLIGKYDALDWEESR